MLRVISSKGSKWVNKFLDKSDLPSLREVTHQHIALFENNQMAKNYITSDQLTHKILQEVTINKPYIRDLLVKERNPTENQQKTIQVKVANINNHQQFLHQYKLWKQKGRKRIIGVGGPAAIDQTLLCSLIPQIRDNVDVHFYCKEIGQSNYIYSGMQSHVRDATAYNARPHLWGIWLLPKMIKQRIFKIKYQELQTTSFCHISLKWDSLRLWKIYIRSDLNAYLEKIRAFFGWPNEVSISKQTGFLSQVIQEQIQRKENLKINTALHYQGKYRTRAILVYDQYMKNIKKTIKGKLNQALFKQGVELESKVFDGQELLRKYFPHHRGFKSYKQAFGEFSNTLQMITTIKENCQKNGSVWRQNTTVKEIYIDVDKTTNRPFFVGIKLDNGQFVPGSCAHVTNGYKAKFVYEGTGQEVFNNDLTVSTGVSIVGILKKTPQMKKLDINQQNFDIGISSIHYSKIMEDENYVLIRMAAGGDTGFEKYKPQTVLYITYMAKKLYGESFIGIHNVYGCCRTINYRNSTEVAQVADGLIISYGKGGTGHTKRTAQAIIGMKIFGFHKQISNYFKQTLNKRMKNINPQIQRIEKGQRKFGMIYNVYEKTLKALFR